MGFCSKGIDKKIISQKITIEVNEAHPLIKLANKIEWKKLEELVLPDLKTTTAQWKWQLGRKLCLRTHLGVYLLQQLLNTTDRGIENSIRLTPLYQVFCGYSIVKKWHCPDHTKINEFRSRLSPETQCFPANEIARLAVKHKFAKAEHIDIDSTVQEPDMQYPATCTLLKTLSSQADRIQKIITKKTNINFPEVDLKSIRKLERDYFLTKRKKVSDIIKKETALKKVWVAVSEQATPVIQHSHWLKEPFIFNSLNTREKNLVDHFTSKAPIYLSHTFEQLMVNTRKPSKIYSFHRNQVDCFTKRKHNKPYEFGRQFQIGRIEGNFVWSIPNHSVRMSDAECFKPMIRGHLNLFQTPIKSVGTDKGYYAKENEQFALDLKVEDVAVQCPKRKFHDPPNNPITAERLTELVNRRSGIEPIIGHLKKRWQLGRSRMKSDRTTEASGFAAMLGFNLHQLIRNLGGEVKPNAA
jgi:IS5 family transposase